MKKTQKILISPLDWGLGHATRLIPIIQYYLKLGDEIIIAGYGKSFELLKIEFPLLKFEYLPGFHISYSSGGSQILKVLLQLPFFFYWKRKERVLLKQLIQLHKPDRIISDNRYGLTSKDTKTILITHQLRLLFSDNPFIDKFIQRQLRKWIEKFDECWMPDVKGKEGLTGKMTRPNRRIKNAVYIGWLSRFKEKEIKSLTKYDVVVIVSGPEPQRTILLNEFKKYLLNTTHQCLLVSGIPSEREIWNKEYSGLHIVNHLSSNNMLEVLVGAKIIICRSGYSSIMDLLALNKRAILIPTPGQMEQEYLSEFLSKKGLFTSIQQNKLVNISQLIECQCETNELNEDNGNLFFPNYAY